MTSIPTKLFAVALLVLCQSATAQTTIDVSIDEARDIATRALFSGEPELALQIAQAILLQQPDDRASLLVVAAAAPQLGDPRAGRLAGARAWTLSDTDIEKYEAARLTALAAANEERYTLSTFWLRRALTVVPNDDERARTVQDARAITRLNPWSTQLSFSLVPSSNVNGGAEDDVSTAPGNPTGTLSEDATALAGVRASLSFGTQYRLHENAQSRTTIGLQYQVARTRITEDTTIPDKAFDTTSIEGSLRHIRALENGTIAASVSRGTFEYQSLNLSAGTTETLSYDILRLGLDRQMSLSDRTTLFLSGSRELLEYEATGIGEVQRTILGGGLSYRLESGDRISGTVTNINSTGDSVNFTSQEQILSGSYSWADPIALAGWAAPIGPVTLSMGGGMRWADYPDYGLIFPVDGGRQDKTVFANMNIGFPNFEYAGFTPGLRLDVSKADSNVSRFDRTTTSMSFTIRSAF